MIPFHLDSDKRRNVADAVDKLVQKKPRHAARTWITGVQQPPFSHSNHIVAVVLLTVRVEE